MERWQFWKERLLWVATTNDVQGLEQRTRDIARRAAEDMESVEEEARVEKEARANDEEEC